MSLAGLHRSLRGVSVGQFAMIEVTSSPGSRRLSAAFARLGAGAAGPALLRRARGGRRRPRAGPAQAACSADLLAREPGLAADVVLGIEAGLLLEDRFAEHLLAAWGDGRSSLR